MATSVVTLTTSWALVATGACYISMAKSSDQAGAALPLDSTPAMKGALVHVGSTAPAADSFAYHEVLDNLNYQGTEKVYMRTVSGTQVVKCTTIV